MKKTITVLCAALAVGVSARGATVTVGTVAQDAATRWVTIPYTLDEEAIVTFESTHGTRVTGDVYRIVPAGSREIRWYPRDGATADDAFALRAWPKDDPPLYFVLDLEVPSRKWYYPSAEAMPFAPTNAYCRAKCLVMRRIYAKDIVWPQGSPSSEAGRVTNEGQSYVKLTNDYYMAIFPTTIGQSRRICANSRSSRNEDDLPVDAVGCHALRGADFSWPENGHEVASDSDIGRLRALSGGLQFDLPTEAEWEYACRAGSSGALNAEGEIGDLAWYAGNNVDDGVTNRRGTTRAPGLRKPNAWGLYDMLGNVSEWCLDGYQATRSSSADVANPIVAPVGPAGRAHSDGTYQRVKRGGSYLRKAYAIRSAWRAGLNQTWSLDNADGQSAIYCNGYRLVLPIVPASK